MKIGIVWGVFTVLLGIVFLVLIAISIIFQFAHPELTDTQRLMILWRETLVMFIAGIGVLIGLNMWLRKL